MHVLLHYLSQRLEEKDPSETPSIIESTTMHMALHLLDILVKQSEICDKYQSKIIFSRRMKHFFVCKKVGRSK